MSGGSGEERAGPLLVIGYGSELRGDDAAGIRVAERVAQWRNPDIQAVAVHQLLPELAEVVSAVRAVVFVDADATRASGEIQIRPVGLHPSSPSLDHTGDPAWLLELADRLYGRRPEGWLLALPVSDMAMRMSLSERAERAVRDALCEIVALAHRYGIGVEEADGDA